VDSDCSLQRRSRRTIFEAIENRMLA
jgi:hypothetical protein